MKSPVSGRLRGQTGPPRRVAGEADETLYRLELLGKSGLIKSEHLKALMKEAIEPVAIVTASGNTAKGSKSVD